MFMESMQNLHFSYGFCFTMGPFYLFVSNNWMKGFHAYVALDWLTSSTSPIRKLQSSWTASTLLTSSWATPEGDPPSSNQWSRKLELPRVEICRDRHDRQSCKICATCVNFPGKQRDFSHIFCSTTRFSLTKSNFALKLLKFYTDC